MKKLMSIVLFLWVLYFVILVHFIETLLCYGLSKRNLLNTSLSFSFTDKSNQLEFISERTHKCLLLTCSVYSCLLPKWQCQNSSPFFPNRDPFWGTSLLQAVALFVPSVSSRETSTGGKTWECFRKIGVFAGRLCLQLLWNHSTVYVCCNSIAVKLRQTQNTLHKIFVVIFL